MTKKSNGKNKKSQGSAAAKRTAAAGGKKTASKSGAAKTAGKAPAGGKAKKPVSASAKGKAGSAAKNTVNSTAKASLKNPANRAEKKAPKNTAAPAVKKNTAENARTYAMPPDQVLPKKKGKIIALVIIAAVIVTALAVGGNYYLKQSNYYKEHFFDGTVINGVDCSQMTAGEAARTVQNALDQYSFTFTDHEGRSSTVTAEEIGVTFTDNGEIRNILDAQENHLWLFRKDEEDRYQVTADFTYEEEKLREWVRQLPCVNDGTPPTDAYEVQNDEGFWEIVPETYGDELDGQALEDIIVNAVNQAEPSADLTGTDLFYRPSVLADDETLTADVEQKNAAILRAQRIEEITDVELTFNSYVDKVTLGKEQLLEMITDDENGDPVISEEAVKDWVRSWAQDRGFTEDPNLFVTHGGKLVNVGYGILSGWSLDLEATAQKAWKNVSAGKSKTIRPVLVDDAGSRQTDATYVEINIYKQTMWFYLNGEELVETPVVTGDIVRGYDTPGSGIWYIYSKNTNYVLMGPRYPDGSYEYAVFVNYWMPFNGQIGIHDMTTRPEFGGEIYKGNGSHGCVNTPLENVTVIFENAPVGTPVVVHSEDL